ncbi:DUF5719 family protein [Candidatus Nanopelagicales bacterium]|nr:DUF5719 family protein [Candidatus Nanopelagicales bacterium]
MNKSGFVIVGLVGACGGVLALATTSATPNAASQIADADVERERASTLSVACPDLAAAKNRSNWVTLANVPGQPGQTETGSFDLFAQVAEEPLGTVDQVGAATAVSEFPGKTVSAIARAQGGLTPGSIAASVSQDTGDQTQALASAPCLAAGAQAWLVGGGAADGQRDRLVLINPTDSDSAVDLDFYGPTGKIEATRTDAIGVKAGETTEIALDAKVQATPVLAIRVRTTVGLVAPYITGERSDGLTPRGREVIFPSTASKRSVIAGIPAGVGPREISLFAPSGKATVELQALGTDGALDIADRASVELKKGRVTTVDLAAELAGEATAVVVSSSTPVLASLLVENKEGGAAATKRKEAIAAAEAKLDQAKDAAAKADATQALSDIKAQFADSGSDVMWLAAESRIPNQAVATSLLPNTKTTVALAALDGDVAAEVAILPTGKSAEPLVVRKEVTLTEDVTVEVKLTAEKANYTVVVTKTGGSGNLYAAHSQQGQGRTVTGYQLLRLTPWVTLPDVEPVFGP